MRARILAERYEPEPGEVFPDPPAPLVPVASVGDMRLDLDELSWSDEDDPETAARAAAGSSDLHAETLQRLQQLIAEKEQALKKKRKQQQQKKLGPSSAKTSKQDDGDQEEDPELLQHRLKAQESLLEKLEADLGTVDERRVEMDSFFETVPSKMEGFRAREDMLRTRLQELEDQVASFLRLRDDMTEKARVLAAEAAQKEAKREVLKEKVRVAREKLAAVLPALPSATQLHQAELIEDAFVAALPQVHNGDVSMCATFSQMWLADSRQRCSRAFQHKGAAVASQMEEDGLLKRADAPSIALVDPDGYRSPLLALRSYRVSACFLKSMGGSGWLHPSFSNRVMPNTTMCRFELGGTCNDFSCPFLHARDFLFESEQQLLEDVSQYLPEDEVSRLKSLVNDKGLLEAAKTLAQRPKATAVPLDGAPRAQKKRIDIVPPPPPPPPVSSASTHAAATTSRSAASDDSDGDDGAFLDQNRFFRRKAIGDTSLIERAKRDAHNIRLWLDAADALLGSPQLYGKARDVLVEAMQCNPESERLSVAYMNVQLLMLEAGTTTRLAVETAFTGELSKFPFCVAVWLMRISLSSAFAEKLGLLDLAMDVFDVELGKREIEQVEHPAVESKSLQGSYFQLILARLQLLLDAGRRGDDVARSGLWLEKLLVPRYRVQLRLLCESVRMGARILPNVCPGLFQSFDDSSYVLFNLPSKPVYLADLAKFLEIENESASAAGWSVQDRFPICSNLIGVRLAQGSRSAAKALFMSLAKECSNHPDIHYLAASVFPEGSNSFFASKYVYMLGRILDEIEEQSASLIAPPPPSANETLAPTEQVCAWLCMALTSYAPRPIFEEARFVLKTQCGPALMQIFWASYLSFVAGQSPAKPFESLVDLARDDLVSFDECLGHVGSSTVWLADDEWLLPSMRERSVLFDTVLMSQLLPSLPPIARRRLVSDMPENTSLVLWTLYADLTDSNLSVEACLDARMVALNAVQKNASIWEFYQALLLLDWVTGGPQIQRSLETTSRVLFSGKGAINALLWRTVHGIYMELNDKSASDRVLQASEPFVFIGRNASKDVTAASPPLAVERNEAGRFKVVLATSSRKRNNALKPRASRSAATPPPPPPPPAPSPSSSSALMKYCQSCKSLLRREEFSSAQWKDGDTCISCLSGRHRCDKCHAYVRHQGFPLMGRGGKDDNICTDCCLANRATCCKCGETGAWFNFPERFRRDAKARLCRTCCSDSAALESLRSQLGERKLCNWCGIFCSEVEFPPAMWDQPADQQRSCLSCSFGRKSELKPEPQSRLQGSSSGAPMKTSTLVLKPCSRCQQMLDKNAFSSPQWTAPLGQGQCKACLETLIEIAEQQSRGEGEIPADSRCAYVANLPEDMGSGGLYEIFRDLNVRHAHVVYDKKGVSRRFGFVDFATLQELEQALARNGQGWHGLRLAIRLARDSPDDKKRVTMIGPPAPKKKKKKTTTTTTATTTTKDQAESASSMAPGEQFVASKTAHIGPPAPPKHKKAKAEKATPDAAPLIRLCTQCKLLLSKSRFSKAQWPKETRRCKSCGAANQEKLRKGKPTNKPNKREMARGGEAVQKKLKAFNSMFGEFA